MTFAFYRAFVDVDNFENNVNPGNTGGLSSFNFQCFIPVLQGTLQIGPSLLMSFHINPHNNGKLFKLNLRIENVDLDELCT